MKKLILVFSYINQWKHSAENFPRNQRPCALLQCFLQKLEMQRKSKRIPRPPPHTHIASRWGKKRVIATPSLYCSLLPTNPLLGISREVRTGISPVNFVGEKWQNGYFIGKKQGINSIMYVWQWIFRKIRAKQASN